MLEPNYPTNKFFSENLVSTEMKKKATTKKKHKYSWIEILVRFIFTENKQNSNVWVLAWLC